MDRVDLDRLEALHRAATPGPWRATDKAVWTAPDEAGHYAAFDGVVAQCVDGYVTADAALIAAARNALPALLARLRALEEVARAAGIYREIAEHAEGHLRIAKDVARDDLDAALAAAKEGA